MPENFEIIRARIKDDAAVLIDRLLRTKQKNIVLVLPKNSIIAINPDSLKILKQESESVGKILFIDTENQMIKSSAEILGINNAETGFPIGNPVSAVSKSDVKMKQMMDIVPPSKPIIYETYNPPEVPDNNSDLEKNLENFYSDSNKKNVKNYFFTKKTVISFKFLVFIFIFLGIALLFSALYLALPKANIKISLKKMPIKAVLPVAVSKNIGTPNLSGNIIPGQYFSLSKSGSKIINTQDVKKETLLKSGGTIFIYNAYSSAPQKLVAQTRFETKEGKIFRIQNAIIVPGAKMVAGKLTPSSIKAEVMADAFGEEYNIGPSYFTIPGFKESPKYAGFYAKSVEPMIGKKINTEEFSKDELEKAKKELQNELAEELKNETLSTLKDSSDLKIIDGASNVRIDELQFLPPKIIMKITWQTMLFREKDLKFLVENFISSKYQGLDNLNFNDIIQYPKASKVDFKKGELFFTLDIDKENPLSVDLNALKKELSGRDENEIRSLISEKSFISSATISLWPFWVKHAPGNLNKIEIILDNK